MRGCGRGRGCRGGGGDGGSCGRVRSYVRVKVAQVVSCA